MTFGMQSWNFVVVKFIYKYLFMLNNMVCSISFLVAYMCVYIYLHTQIPRILWICFLINLRWTLPMRPKLIFMIFGFSFLSDGITSIHYPVWSLIGWFVCCNGFEPRTLHTLDNHSTTELPCELTLTFFFFETQAL